MDNSFPHHDTVDGDLLIASKTLAMLGWAAPAALTARVAIERELLELVAFYGKRPPTRPSAGDLADKLYKGREPLVTHLRDSIGTPTRSSVTSLTALT